MSNDAIQKAINVINGAKAWLVPDKTTSYSGSVEDWGREANAALLALRTQNPSAEREMSDDKIIGMALINGFMISSAHGQDAGKLMPVTNAATILRFAREIIRAALGTREGEGEFTKEEKFVLEWLSKDDGQYGECRGKSLDKLMSLGLVEWKRRDVRGDDYGVVGLTEKGFKAALPSPPLNGVGG